LHSIKLVGLFLVLIVFITSCGGASDESTTQATPTETTPAQTPTTSETVTPTSDNGDGPTEEPSDSEPLVAFMMAYTGYHNYFTFEIVNNKLLYQAIRYDYYPLDTDSINDVKPGDYIAYVGSTFNLSNDCFLVYVTGGKLYYKVINPYAIPGPDPERCSMGAVHEGILEGYATSIAANYVRFTYWGEYGVDVNWTDNYGKGHYAVIDQWNGITEQGFSAADDRPQVSDPTARGRVLPRPDYLEISKEAQEESGAIVNWISEEGNNLELKFDRTGGSISGSFWWRHSMNFQWPETDPDYPAQTVTSINIGDFTGTYSGGETGSFEGKVTGTVSVIVNGKPTESCESSLDGTWWAEMDASGHISGTIHYTVTYPGGSYEDWLDFEATVSEE
jgi:hypothetical protein